jgi:hypothetical protein
VGSAIQIQSVKKRAFLNQVAQGAIAQAITLTAALTAVQTQCNSASFAKGRIFVSQSGSGQSASFQIGVAGAEWTPDNVFGLTQELIELIATVCADGSFAYGLDDTTQTAALAQAMMANDSLAGIRQQCGDWTGLNIPSIGGVPA